MARGASALVPEGTVGVFDRRKQLAALDDAARQLRAVVLMHDNDPIGALSPDLLVKRPPWLDGERGRGVPEGMGWAPLIAFWQTGVDAMNAEVTVPGEFGSFSHDYGPTRPASSATPTTSRRSPTTRWAASRPSCGPGAPPGRPHQGQPPRRRTAGTGQRRTDQREVGGVLRPPDRRRRWLRSLLREARQAAGDIR